MRARPVAEQGVLTIDRMGERGDGMAAARAVPRTLPGEVLQLDAKGAFHILKPSTERIAPFCPVFDRCGGCKLQHWAPSPYQAWKRGLLQNALQAKGVTTTINALVDAHGHGRRRAVFHVRECEGAWQAGFMAAGTHALVPIVSCPILVPRLQTTPALAARFGPLFGNCDVQITAADNGLDIAIKAHRKLGDKAVQGLAGLMQEHKVARIAVNGETLTQLQAPFIVIGPGRVALPIGAFLQATQQGEETLAELVLANIGKARHVADLFCGLGPFALRLASKYTVTAIDSDKPAMAAVAQALRFVQGLRPVTPQVRDLFRNPLTAVELNTFDAVVLDPPRQGAEAQCQNLAASKIKRVVMVSCDVQSFARDAAILVAADFNLETVTPVDQFKYSAHLECVGVFKRR